MSTGTFQNIPTHFATKTKTKPSTQDSQASELPAHPEVPLVQVITPADLLRFDVAGPQYLGAVFLLLLYLTLNVFYHSIAALLLVICFVYGAYWLHNHGMIKLDAFGLPPVASTATNSSQTTLNSSQANFFLRPQSQSSSNAAAEDPKQK